MFNELIIQPLRRQSEKENGREWEKANTTHKLPEKKGKLGLFSVSVAPEYVRKGKVSETLIFTGKVFFLFGTVPKYFL